MVCPVCTLEMSVERKDSYLNPFSLKTYFRSFYKCEEDDVSIISEIPIEESRNLRVKTPYIA